MPELSEGDLEQLGVSLGNRRRLLKALAERGAEPAKSKPSDAEASGEAERRQVTVLFCDMVGSTALSGTVDPELLGNLIRRYQDAAAGAIGRFGGFVAKFMGDGVFWPTRACSTLSHLSSMRTLRPSLQRSRSVPA